MAALGVAVSAMSLSVQAAVEISPSSGQPAYSYPIPVPPGINGQAPALALAFGGGAEQSTVGLGWSLTGVPLITRCASSLKTDGDVRRPTLSPTDKLCLDGRRLIPTSADGVPLALSMTSTDAKELAAGETREFRTEAEPYVRIRAYGTANGADSGPKYFRVWANDGRQYVYGDAPEVAAGAGRLGANATVLAAPIGTSTAPRAVMWRLARSTDVAGNAVDYKYSTKAPSLGTKLDTAGTPGWESVLDEIQYAGNKVVFTYVAKAPPGEDADRWTPTAELGDIGESIFAGTKLIDSLSVASITTYVNSPNVGQAGPAPDAVAVRTFRLGYDYGAVDYRVVRMITSNGDLALSEEAARTFRNTGRSRLRSIQHCVGGPDSAKCLRKVEFEYSVGSGRAYGRIGADGFELTDPLVPRNGVSYGAIAADFDGDGRTDLLRWSSDPQENLVLLSKGDGTFKRMTVGETGLARRLMSDSCEQTQLLDFDHDMRVDLLVYSAVGKGFNGQTECNGESSYFMRNKGDGTFEKVALQNVTLSRIRAAQSTANGTTVEFSVTEGREFYVGDLTGDGIPDIVTTRLPAASWDSRGPRPDLCFGNDCTQVYRGNGNGTFTRIDTGELKHQTLYDFSVVYNGNMPASGPVLRDINGDGKADLVVGTRWQPLSTPLPNVLLSRGDGTFSGTAFVSACELEGVGVGQCRLDSFDYNGDGYADLIAPSYQTGILNKLYVGGTAASPWSPVKSFNLDIHYYQILENNGSTLLPIDVNQDGKDDLLRLGTLEEFGKPSVNNLLWLSQGDGQFTLDGGFFLAFADKLMHTRRGDVTTYVGNFTGDGGVEFLIASASGNELWGKVQRGLPDKLVAVTEESGLRTTLVHVPLAKPIVAGDPLGPRYQPDPRPTDASDGPLYDAPPPSQMSVVGVVNRPTGIGAGTLPEFYSYGGLKYDTANRVDAGFRVSKRQASGADGTSLTTRTTFHQRWPYTGAVATQETYVGTLKDEVPATPLSWSQSIYCDASDSEAAIAAAKAAKTNCTGVPVLRRPFTPWSQSTGADLLGRALPTATQEVTVNAEAAPLVTKSSVVHGDEQFVTTTTTVYAAENRSCSDVEHCSWIFNRPATVTTRKTVPSTLPTASAGTGPDASSLDGELLPSAALTPDSIVFDDTVNGQTSAPQAVTVTNTGRAPLAIASATATGDFQVAANNCATLEPGATCSIGVTFRPSTGGVRTGELTVASNGRSSPVGVALRGEGGAMPLTVPATDFGQVRVMQMRQATVPVTNRSGTALTLSAVSAGSLSGTGFGFVSTTCGSSLAVGAQCAVVVSFTPPARGESKGALTLSTSLGAQVASLRGQGTQGEASLSALGAPFGPQHLGTNSEPRSLTVTNIGDDDLTVARVSTTGDFNVLGNECVSVAPGDSCAVQVRFKPTATGTRTGELTVASTDPAATVSTALQGQGVNLGLVADVSSLDFGEVQTGETVRRTVTLSNPGTVDAVGVVIEASTWFSLSGNNCGSTILAGGSCSFTAEYAPRAPGESGGVLLISSLGKELRIAASGVARIPSWTFTGNEHGGVAVGSPFTQPYTFTNTGVGPLTITVPATPVTGDSVFVHLASESTCVSGVYGPGQSCVMRVRFTPTDLLTYTGLLTLQVRNWADPAVPFSKVVGLRGQGLGGYLEVANPTVAFGSVNAGSTADSASITVTNSGNVETRALAFSALPAGFTLVNDLCSGQKLGYMNEGLGCSFTFRFSPTAGQSYGGTVTLSDGHVATRTFTLSGKGLKASASLASLSFGGVAVGAVVDQSAVLTNTGNVDLTLSGLGSGAVSGADFSWVSTSCGATLAAGAQCAVTVRFAPSTNANRTGTLAIGSSVGTVSATLSGTGQRAVLGVSTGSVAMPDTQVHELRDSGAVTVTNSGNVAASSLTLSAPAGFAIIGSNCGGGLAAGANCSFQVRFAPTEARAYGGTLSVTAAVPAVSTSLAVSGTGRNPSGSLGGLNFGTVPVNASSIGGAVLTNTGVGGLAINTDYSVSGNRFVDRGTTSCPSLLGAGQTCTVSVDFQPNSVGPFSGSVSVSTGAGVLNAALSGVGGGAILGPSTGSLAFGNQNVGTTSGTQTVTIWNSGTSTSGTLSVGVPGGFVKPFDNCSGRALTRSESDSCSFGIAFAPSAAASYGGNVVISDGSASAAVSVSGSGIQPAPALTVTPAGTIDFGSVVGEATKSLTYTVSNGGGAASGMSFSFTTGTTSRGFFGRNGGSCGTTLAAGASCTLVLTYSAFCGQSGTNAGVMVVAATNMQSFSRTMSANTVRVTCQ